MRRAKRVFLYPAIWFILALLLPSTAQASCSKIFDFAFFETEVIYTREGKLAGPLYVDLAIGLNILKLSDCEFRLQKLAWSRIPNSIRTGKVDGTFGASFSAERAEYGWYSSPYRETIIGMLMRKENIPNFKPKSFKDIVDSNLTIGTRLGIWYGKEYDDAYKNNDDFRANVLRAGHQFSLTDWVLADRTDIVFNAIRPANFYIAQKGYSKILAIHPFPIYRGNIHILLGKKTTNEHDIEVINRNYPACFSSFLLTDGLPSESMSA